MSIGVELERLAEEIERFGSTAYVLSVSNDGRPHAVAVDVRWSDDRLVAGIGKSTAANVVERPRISLLWSPFEPGGYSLIIDGAADVDAEGRLSFAPSKGVLHRPAPQGWPSSSDCVPLVSGSPER